MKTKILFVDDEAMVLQGLERSMRCMRNEWEMTFTDSGAKALELLAQIQFDVIISDMRMPGMNGAELLNQVMAKYPRTVRLILSGYSDQELILQSVGSTHQYLAKPCEPEDLKNAIARATELNSSLENDDLQQLVAQIDRLPSPPALYMEIVKILESPDASMRQVGAIIERDISMTAQMLRMVNSSFFGLRRQISNVVEAINFLGIDTVKSLVLSIKMFSQFDETRLKGFSITALWDHSMRVACCARLIGKLENCGRKFVDEAFSAGMLHDTGKLLLAMQYPDAYSQAAWRVANKEDICGVEKELLGATHAEVGGLLLGLWGLPVPIVEAVTFHHFPAQCLTTLLSPLTIVHAANAIENEHSSGIAETLDHEYLLGLGLESKVSLWKESFQDALSKGLAA